VPARLSYIGVPRWLAWGYGYGALCMVALGTLAVTFRADWAIFTLVTTLFLACSAHGLGCRVRVVVWPRAQGGYDVGVQRWGWRARYVAASLPELSATESSRKQRARANPFAPPQLDLTLDLGTRLLSLPPLHVGVSHADALQRLEPFRRALRELGPTQPSESNYEAGDHSGGWIMPVFETSAAHQVEGLTWANGTGNSRHLRYGVTLTQTPVVHSASVRFAAALAGVLLSAALPSSQPLEVRLQVAASVFIVILALLAFATYAVRCQLRGTPNEPVVVVQYLALGIACYTRCVPLGDGVRVLFAKETSETSESTSTSIAAYLVTRTGQRHAITGMTEEDHAARKLLASFSAALIRPRVVREALLAPPRAEPLPSYEEPPASGGLAELPRSRLAELGVFIALLALLVAFATATQELLDLRHATAWVQTTYRWETVRAGKSTRTRFHPALDPSAELSPKPAAQITDAPCWVIDDPHGHDIARYTSPTGPVTFLDKIRVSLVLTFASWLALAAIAAGPFLRRRRSLDVRAG